jgi:hypothetical protein
MADVFSHQDQLAQGGHSLAFHIDGQSEDLPATDEYLALLDTESLDRS